MASPSRPRDEANALFAALGNLNLSNLSPQAKAEWKRIGKKIAKVLPQEREGGGVSITDSGGAMEQIISDLKHLRGRAEDEDEMQLLTALEPVEKMIRRFMELFDNIDAYRDAYKVFNKKLDQV